MVTPDSSVLASNYRNNLNKPIIGSFLRKDAYLYPSQKFLIKKLKKVDSYGIFQKKFN